MLEKIKLYCNEHKNQIKTAIEIALVCTIIYKTGYKNGYIHGKKACMLPLHILKNEQTGEVIRLIQFHP